MDCKRVVVWSVWCGVDFVDDGVPRDEGGVSLFGAMFFVPLHARTGR